jgi:hypothetical protein
VTKRYRAHREEQHPGDRRWTGAVNRAEPRGRYLAGHARGGQNRNAAPMLASPWMPKFSLELPISPTTGIPAMNERSNIS